MLQITFERGEAPPEIILLCLNLYLFKLGLRDVRNHLFEERSFWRKHEAVNQWVQRTNRATKRYSKTLKRVTHIILDKTEVRVGGEYPRLWAALDQVRRVVLENYLSKTRSGLVATSFMKKLIQKYGEKVLFVNRRREMVPLGG